MEETEILNRILVVLNEDYQNLKKRNKELKKRLEFYSIEEIKEGPSVKKSDLGTILASLFTKKEFKLVGDFPGVRFIETSVDGKSIFMGGKTLKKYKLIRKLAKAKHVNI